MELSSIELYGKLFAQSVTVSRDMRMRQDMRDDACLSYTRNGTQEIYSATRKIVARDGESILMKCGNYVAGVVDASPAERFTSMVFHLDPESIKKAFGEKDLSFLRVERAPEPMDPALKVDRSELLDSFVVSMMPYFAKPERRAAT